MEIELFPLETFPTVMIHPIDYGFVYNILHMKSVEQEKLKLGCRQCGQHSNRVLTFNGVVSHLKTLYVATPLVSACMTDQVVRHGIHELRDEDVFASVPGVPATILEAPVPVATMPATHAFLL
jgi:hypothetical protein